MKLITAPVALTTSEATAVSVATREPGPRQWARALPGIALVGLLALIALEIGRVPWLQANGISALTLAIALGMLVGNTIYPRLADAAAGGVAFSKQTLLRAGIILYGLRLTFRDIANVGIAGVLIDSLVLTSTFALAWWAGTRVFGLDRKTAMLIGAGSSICGAAAVMAAEPVVRGRAEQVTVAVSTVVVFGTLAIFLYPALYHLNAHYQFLRVNPVAYGIFAGSTIHEVAQVVAAGRAVTDAAANTAVITKMVRVMMLAPFLIALSAYLARRPESAAGDRGGDEAGELRLETPDRHSLVRAGVRGGCSGQFGPCPAALADDRRHFARYLRPRDGHGGPRGHDPCLRHPHGGNQAARPRGAPLWLADFRRSCDQHRRLRGARLIAAPPGVDDRRRT